MGADMGATGYQPFQHIQHSTLAIVGTAAKQHKRLRLWYASGETGDGDAKHLLYQPMLFVLLRIVIGQQREELP
jgi:hypothetical protein